jgi:hypothetical protein
VLDSVQGGRGLVAWRKVTRPKELDGLGVLDLTTLGWIRLAIKVGMASRNGPGQTLVVNHHQAEACCAGDVRRIGHGGSG